MRHDFLSGNASAHLWKSRIHALTLQLTCCKMEMPLVSSVFCSKRNGILAQQIYIYNMIFKHFTCLDNRKYVQRFLKLMK